jgi:uncharacterized LabA/DUF88 family protein
VTPDAGRRKSRKTHPRVSSHATLREKKLEDNIALLIDFENIAAGTEKENLGRFKVEALINRLKDKGRVLVARAFGDWGRFARFKQDLLANNITMMELTSHGMQDKNRADIAMVVDCLELAFTRAYVDTYVIVSGDSDFTPLVLKLRELNKRVIGVGTRGSTSRLIINACDEFIFYDTLVQSRERSVRQVTRKLPKGPSKAMEILLEALEGLQREDPTPPLASIVKTAMLRRRPDFNENDSTFSSFTRFLESARDAGIVTLHRDKKSGGYRVDAVEEAMDDVLEVSEPAPRARTQPARAAKPAASPVAAPAETAPRKEEVFDDPYFPAGSESLVAALHAAKLGPMAYPTRLAALEALCEAVEDRNKKRKRVTIAFVQEDIKRLLRRTHPDVSSRAIRDLLTAVMNAGQFIHKDSTPIRSANAPFMLAKDAAKLNHAYVEYALARLVAAGESLDDVATVADLFLGDAERTRDVETILAWIAARGPEQEPSYDDDDDRDDTDAQEHAHTPSSSFDLDDLDAFLLADDGDAPTPSAPPAPAESSERPKRSRGSRRTRSADAEEAEALPAEPEAAPAPVATPVQPEPAAEKPRRAKSSKPKAAADATADEAPPKKAKSKSRAKSAEPAESNLDDLDALLDIGE